MKERLNPPRQAWETVEYTDSPELPDVEQLKIVDSGFLPRPEELMFKEPKSEKVTILLDEKTLSFFKNSAQKIGESYQIMIRNQLQSYVAEQS